MAAIWKGLDFRSVFLCCLTSYSHLLNRLQEWDAPDCAFCLAAALGSFPFESIFQEIFAENILRAKQTLGSELYASRDALCLILKLYHVLPLSRNRKVLLAVYLAAFLHLSVRLLLKFCLH